MLMVKYIENGMIWKSKSRWRKKQEEEQYNGMDEDHEEERGEDINYLMAFVLQ